MESVNVTQAENEPSLTFVLELLVIRSVVDGTMFFTVNISRYDCGGQNV